MNFKVVCPKLRRMHWGIRSLHYQRIFTFEIAGDYIEGQ